MIKYIFTKHYKCILGIAFFSIICAFLSLLLPDILADIISIGIGTSNMDFIYNNGIVLIIISVLILISSIMASFFSNKLGAKIGFELRNKLYEKTLSLDDHDINNYGISSLVVRNTNDINQIQTMVSLFFKTIVFTMVLGIGGIIKAILKAQNIPILSLVIIISILVVAITLFIIFKTVIPKYNRLQTKLDKINKRIQEVLHGILVIKVSNQENYEQNKCQKINQDYSNLEYYLNKIMSLLNPFITLSLSICSLVIIYIIFKNATSLTELANMLAFSEYATQVISSFLSLAICFILLPKAFVSYRRIIEVINTYNLIYDNPNALDITTIDSIKFKNVSFNYPNSSEYVIKDINLEIKKGERIAVIGPTGSGKSSIVNLINRFYDVTEGSIHINNTDIRKIKITELNKKIATVFQNDFLMRSTIKDSVFTDDKKSIKKAFATACLSELTNDLNQEIEFNGSNLSGGQKQRLQIARALLKNPDILILDDAFSAIDYQTEKQILKNLKEEYPNLIQIIISSRITSIKNVDKIIVINNGQIIGYESHSKLLKICPTYKNIVNTAFKKEDKHE